jgi:HEAT repeat protein
MRDAFCRREFLDEILSGLTIWGKPKYDQVTLLIQVLGRVFIEPLLDRMAEEENMSLRRFMMDRVQSFGGTARPFLLARLDDKRWYVLRNIIVMLRALGPLQEVEQLRPLLKHANQKVRLEVLKSLMQVGDPVAQRQVLHDLDSSDREIQLTALGMVDRNSPPDMVRKLLTLVMGGGYTAVECELKAAAVHALGEIGRPEVLPELAKVLAARSLLAFKALNRLKTDIVRSFEQYPVAAALPLLVKLAEGSDEVARQAAESLKKLRSASP